jgi:hypothetical protein
MNYVATTRAFCFDLAATAFLFVSASVMAGRVWRFPFDDEIATLLHQRTNLSRIFPATTDVHPPFSYLMFYGLRQLGFSDAAMRFVSLLLTFLSTRTLSNPGFDMAFAARRGWKAGAAHSSGCRPYIRLDAFGGESRRCDTLVPSICGSDHVIRGALPRTASRVASLVVGPRTRARRVNRFLRGADRAAVLDPSSFAPAPISLVVRSFLLAYCDGRRRGWLLLSLLDIHLRDDSGGGRILPRCCPFRFDEYAWLLRWQCPRNQPGMDRHSDHHRFCPGGSLRNRSAKAR